MFCFCFFIFVLRLFICLFAYCRSFPSPLSIDRERERVNEVLLPLNSSSFLVLANFHGLCPLLEASRIRHFTPLCTYVQKCVPVVSSFLRIFIRMKCRSLLARQRLGGGGPRNFAVRRSEDTGGEDNTMSLFL